MELLMSQRICQNMFHVLRRININLERLCGMFFKSTKNILMEILKI